MEIMFFAIAAFFAGMAVTTWSLGDLKKENERLNNKLRRDVPRDAHGRFTRKK